MRRVRTNAESIRTLERGDLKPYQGIRRSGQYDRTDLPFTSDATLRGVRKDDPPLD